jgi:hypothetical protein
MSEADKCEKLAAWVAGHQVDARHQRSQTLYVLGIVTAPTPCHDPILRYAYDEKTAPPTYVIALEFIERPDVCPQVESDREVRYEQQNYAGVHEHLRLIFTDGSTKAIEIERIQNGAKTH